MLLHGGPFHGYKVDGRTVRSTALFIRDSTRLATNEVAEYRQNHETGIYEFARISSSLVQASAVVQRLKQPARRGFSRDESDDNLAQ